jgi:hypothetical protein
LWKKDDREEEAMRAGHSRQKSGEKSASPKAESALAFYVPAEHNIEVIGYFSAGYKRRYAQSPEAKVVNLSDRDTGLERQIKIIASSLYGYPNSTDLDFYRAFLRICDEHITMVPREHAPGHRVLHPQFKKIPISFTTNQLIRYTGTPRTGLRWKEANDFLKRLALTGIDGHIYKAGERRFVNMTTTLFREVYVRGEKLRNGRMADMNYIVPGPWFISNFYYFYFHRVDIALHQRLQSAIAKSLLPILNVGWYAARGQSYAKSYDTLCDLLFIPDQHHLSWVKKQLDAAHEELHQEKFLARWEYESKEGGEWARVIRWWPGEKWYFDQHEQQRRRSLAEGKESKQILLFAPTMPEVKWPESVQAGDEHEASPHWERVKDFYAAIGQDQVSQQKIHEGVETLTMLEKEGYSAADIDAALAWIVKHRRTKFSGEVHSVRLVIKVIGQALREQKQQQPKVERERQLTLEEQASTSWNEDVERIFATLSPAAQDGLRQKAKERLLAQGYKEKFLLERLIKSEMYRLLRQEGVQQ